MQNPNNSKKVEVDEKITNNQELMDKECELEDDVGFAVDFSPQMKEEYCYEFTHKW